ncbi:glycosyltransferase family 32 protein [Weissella cibaria]|uniref:glycosyltransferase family 32 protein n=1 Tax=Weissella cibaria TaxID=137591 RepID=UPI00189B253E|nr:glycosyltransferase [Weissella cibaria]
MIPKVIYYAWFGKKNKPVEVCERIEKWGELNPTFSIVEINETNFDVKSMKFTSEAYDLKKWAFVSDVARLEVIYNNGGIYFDTDVDILKPIDDLLQHEIFFAKESPANVATGLGFGAEKHNKFLGEMLDFYKVKRFDEASPLLTTDAVTEKLRCRGLSDYDVYQVLDNKIVIYPTNIFAPLHFFGGGKIKDESIAVHRYQGSWVSQNDNLFNKVRAQVILRLNFYAPVIRVIKQKMRRT